ncbi:MAG: VWA domain-containing protein [Candidatus Gracilibacteria bacterium]|nr:VWA domain-containing protein [Candidatus Gracilibacteria bacterium]
MFYICIFLILILGIYIYFFYKNKGFVLYCKYGLGIIFLVLSFLISFISIFSYQIETFVKQKAKSSNIVFVLDVSNSMLAADYDDNKTRLQIAKEFIKNFILNNLTNRYGLSIFAGDIINLLPLTSDKDLFNTFLDNADEKSILKGGSNLFEAIDTAKNRFQNDNQNGGAIIILSDFETNLDKKSKDELLQKIQDLQKDLINKNIKLIFVGVGKISGAKIPIGYDIFGKIMLKKDKFGNTIITKFDKDFFGQISFEKFKIDNGNDIGKIQINDIPSIQTEIETNQKVDFSRYVLMIAFLFFMIYLGLFSYFDKKGNTEI